jgi:hypothetical protein
MRGDLDGWGGGSSSSASYGGEGAAGVSLALARTSLAGVIRHARNVDVVVEKVDVDASGDLDRSEFAVLLRSALPDTAEASLTLGNLDALFRGVLAITVHHKSPTCIRPRHLRRWLFPAHPEISDDRVRSICERHRQWINPRFRSWIRLGVKLIGLHGARMVPYAGTALAIARHNLLKSPWDEDLDFLLSDSEYEMLEQSASKDVSDDEVTITSISSTDLGQRLGALAAKAQSMKEVPMMSTIHTYKVRSNRRGVEGVGAGSATLPDVVCISLQFLKHGFFQFRVHTVTRWQQWQAYNKQSSASKPERAFSSFSPLECAGPGFKVFDVFPPYLDDAKVWLLDVAGSELHSTKVAAASDRTAAGNESWRGGSGGSGGSADATTASLDSGFRTLVTSARRVRIEGLDLLVPAQRYLERYCDLTYDSWRTMVKICPHETFANFDVCSGKVPLIPLSTLEHTMQGLEKCQFYFAGKNISNVHDTRHGRQQTVGAK